jgi:hypothetical protein
MLSLLSSIASIPKISFQEEALPYTPVTLNFSGSGSVSGSDYPYTVTNMRCAMTNFDSTNFTTTNTLWCRYKLNNTSFARIISFGRLNDTNSHAFISFSGANYNNYDINVKISGSTLYNASVSIGSSANIYNLFYVFTNTSGNMNMKLFIYNSSGSVLFNALNVNYTVASYNNNPFQEFDYLFENNFGGSAAVNGGVLHFSAKFDTALNTTEMSDYSVAVI